MSLAIQQLGGESLLLRLLWLLEIIQAMHNVLVRFGAWKQVSRFRLGQF